MVDPLNGEQWRCDVGDSLSLLRGLPDACAHMACTSPPYYALRDYGVAGQLGLERTPEEYVVNMVAVFRELRRVLRPDGTFWLNIGDSYNAYNGNRGKGKTHSNGAEESLPKLPSGHGLTVKDLKPKDLIGIPWMLAFALRADGWFLRSECIWHKPNPMTESVRDRPTKSHEQIFLLTKSARYYFDMEAVKEPIRPDSLRLSKRIKKPHKHLGTFGSDTKKGLNKYEPSLSGCNLRSVWKLSLRPYKGAHFATFPLAIPERCIRAGTSEHGCCPACSAPWVRQVEKRRQPTRPGKNVKYLPKSNGDEASASTLEWTCPQVIGNRDPQRHCTTTQTVGWLPSCQCPPAEPIPCLVIDPFAGACTTLLAARRLNRRALGFELNPEYAEMGRKRVSGAAPLFDTTPPIDPLATLSEPVPGLFDHCEE